jgi:hypothetical protein
MTPDRKKPGVAFWATVVVIVGLVLYVLGSGPCDYLFSHGYVSERTAKWMHALYLPYAWAYRHSPESAQRAAEAYCSWWTQLPRLPGTGSKSDVRRHLRHSVEMA